MKIQSVDAYQIFDSRGNPTVEVELTLENGVKGYGLVPSGASTGQFEALELRDGDPMCFRGKSVFKAIQHVKEEIAPIIGGRNVFDQCSLDEAMVDLDGTANKRRLGANAILGVSMAAANAAARAKGAPLYEYLGEGRGDLLPLPEIQIIGDDLFTTSMKRIEEGIDRGIANSVLIKLNQIGTVTETIEAIRVTQKAGWLPVVSARSGETEDAFISHLAVASKAGQLKVGSFARSERMVKWNECLRIERSLGETARFVGADIYQALRG